MATRQAEVPRGLGLTSGGGGGGGMIELAESPAGDNQFHLFKTQAQLRAEEEQDTINRRAMFHKETNYNDKEENAEREELEKHTTMSKIFNTLIRDINMFLNRTVFSDIPEHYTLKKKIAIVKQSTSSGMAWDVLIVLGSLLLCANYVWETYTATYEQQIYFKFSELILTYLFLVDFVFTWCISHSTWDFVFKVHTWIDLMTIVPVFLSQASRNTTTETGFFQIFRFLRVFGLLRILKSFKKLYGLSEVNRQIAQLGLTICSLIFLAAGIIELLENDVKQEFFYDCKYSNALTEWKPSCSQIAPKATDGTCDCDDYKCTSVYDRWDPLDQPSRVRCRTVPFFECIYFIMVTINTVGYGDISPTYFASRLAICCLLVVTLVLLPMELNKLNALLAMKSPFRQVFTPTPNQSHILVAGFVNHREKLEAFFREFFHEDRQVAAGPDFIAVVISQLDPTEDVVSFMLSATVDGRMLYRVGSVLSVEDMDRVSGSKALAIFFLCDKSAHQQKAVSDDLQNALQVLAIGSYNPYMEILTQVNLLQDREGMYDNDVDVTLTLDDYKLSLMARNAVCPGLASMVELLMTSISTVPMPTDNIWYQEYLSGCEKEIYQFPISSKLMARFDYLWPLFCEAIYLHFNMIFIGVSDKDEREIILNPSQFEIEDTFAGDCQAFYDFYTIGIIMSDSQMRVNELGLINSEEGFIDKLIAKLYIAEQHYSISHPDDEEFEHIEGFHPIHDVHTKNETTKIPITTSENEVEDSEMSTVHQSVDRILNQMKDEGYVNSELDKHATNMLMRVIHRTSNTIKDFKTKEYIHVQNDMANQITNDVVIPKIDDASHLTNHVVLIGAEDNLLLILQELRKPLLELHAFHPIVIFGETNPSVFGVIKFQEICSEVYYIQGSPSDHSDLKRLNLVNSFSIQIFSSAFLSKSYDSVKNKIEPVGHHHNLVSTGADTDLLFLYLHIAHSLPEEVFFSVELNNSYNLSVLNLKVSQHITRTKGPLGIDKNELDGNKKDKSLQKMKNKAKRPTHFVRRNSYADDDIMEMHRSAAQDSNAHGHIQDNFWDFGRHIMSLSIYASGRAFVANGFDSLTVQCFYSTISAKFFTALTLGQKFQTMLQILVPEKFIGQEFANIYRAFTARSLCILGIYRAVSDKNKATFPYVYISPKAGSILTVNDRLFVFCNPFLLNNVLDQFKAEYNASLQNSRSDAKVKETPQKTNNPNTWISVQSSRKFSPSEKDSRGRNGWF